VDEYSDDEGADDCRDHTPGEHGTQVRAKPVPSSPSEIGPPR
jgi:hypothetical protein